jgi:sporulation protein ytxC
MTSLCIKTNNQNAIDYLMLNISKINLDNIVFVKKDFSKYVNVIVHYLGNNIPEFYAALSTVITNCILENYEGPIIRKLLLLDYFYFDDPDLDIITDNCKSSLLQNDNKTISSIYENISDRKKYLWSDVLRYISFQKSIFLDGFITFRIKDYINCLENILDYTVSQFVVSREYCEFIDMLKVYISSKSPTVDLIHLIYINEESILLDKNKKVLALTKNNLDQKCYLSDITFSSNDYALNSLLSLLPSKLIIHLISPTDDFINTLQAIFENRVTICTDCDLCKIYQALDKRQGS